VPDRRYGLPIERLNLSVRSYNCLRREGIATVGDVLDRTEDELLSLRNFGQRSYSEVRGKIIELALEPPSDEEPSR
jgi:DNA-directed RNA polymerase subunit alpha